MCGKPRKGVLHLSNQKFLELFKSKNLHSGAKKHFRPAVQSAAADSVFLFCYACSLRDIPSSGMGLMILRYTMLKNTIVATRETTSAMG